MDWVTIDFEASCLPRHGRSVPIEVGIAGPGGTWSWLIRPHPTWRDADWTQEACRLHGIGRDDLDREGIPPHRVMEQVLQAIGPARVFADSPLDRLWWTSLQNAASGAVAQRAAAIRIEDVGTLFDEIGATHEQIMAAQDRAEALCPLRHRAGADALWLRTLIAGLLQEQPVMPPLHAAA